MIRRPTSEPAARWRALVLTLTLAATACGPSPRPDAAESVEGKGPPRVLVVSSTIGYVEPCGCTIDLTLGGIDRLATAIAAERAAGPTAVLLVGSYLFEKAPEPHRVAQEEAKARLIARCLDRIGVDAVVPTAAELVRGRPLYDEVRGVFKAPDVTANVPGGQGRVLTVGEARVGVFGVVAPGDDVPQGTPVDPASVAAEAARLRAAGAQVVIGLGALPRRDLRRLARKVEGVDLWILGDHPHEEAQTSPVAGGYLIEAGDRGRNLGRIELFDVAAPGPLADPLGDAARARRSIELQLKMREEMRARTGDASLDAEIARLKGELDAQPAPQHAGRRFEYTLLPITKEITPDATMAQWIAEYNASLKALNMASAGEVPPVPPGQSGYAGITECEDCHPEAVDFWKTTRHATAWRTLEEAGKTFDAECVGCHVTGWQAPGGSVLGHTDGLTNVQCEACHGPSAIHVEQSSEATVKRNTPVETCQVCHHPHHSPKFDFAVYRPKILGPGHGQPMSKAP